MRRNRLLIGVLLAVAGAAAGDEPDQALITYEATVGERRISGVARALEWSATALAPDSARVQLRVPVAAFDSGHPEFDALLRAALQSELHPFLEVERPGDEGGTTLEIGCDAGKLRCS